MICENRLFLSFQSQEENYFIKCFVSVPATHLKLHLYRDKVLKDAITKLLIKTLDSDGQVSAVDQHALVGLLARKYGAIHSFVVLKMLA